MGRLLLTAEAIDRVLSRMAHEILERNAGTKDLVLIGIKKRGDLLAQRLAEKISEAEHVEIPTGAMDITFYRDDMHLQAYKRAAKESTTIPGSVEKKAVVIVDDVIFTGRTVRAAIDEAMDYGRPRTIQLAVLVDRGGRELPIQPDYVGLRISTGPREQVALFLTELDGMDALEFVAIP